MAHLPKWALAILLAAGPVGAQGTTAPSPLDLLVTEGIRANPSLRARALAVTREDAAITEARGRFLPSLTANARVSSLYGATPNLGALINPAYAALNQLLGQNAFPTNINLTLPQKQEATLRLAQPLFEPRVLAGYRIAQSLRDASAAERDAQRRQLVSDLQTSYLQYARASRAADIFDRTVPLLDESVRVSERLLSAGKVTPDNVLRARAEQSAVVQQRDAAHQLADAARQQLNYLTGRAVDAPLALFADSALDLSARFATRENLDGALRTATAREELVQLDRSSDAVRGQRRIARAAFMPSVNVAVDYGFQGNTIRVSGSRDFAVASLVMSWNLFNGGQDRARVQQASIDAAQLRARRDDAARSIALQVRVAHDAAVVSRTAIGTATERLAAATRTFELVQRRYGEGLASQLELLDARTALTTAELNRLITTYDFYQRVVEYERAAAISSPGVTP